MSRVLALNPGSTSTKLGLFDEGVECWTLTVRHSAEDLAPFDRVCQQYDFRLAVIERVLAEKGCDLKALDGVVGRGGIFDPISGGTYRVTDELVDRLAEGKPWDHASNLGGRLAYGLAQPLGLPAFIVDPVSIDELDDVARVTGLPQIRKVSLVHALNCKAMARKAATDIGKSFTACRLVVAHLGGGLTICALRDGRIVDFDSGNDGGPLAPERAGRLPTAELLKLALAPGAEPAAIKARLAGNAGLKALCGTADLQQIIPQVKAGKEPYVSCFGAFIYNVACSMGMMAAALEGRLDGFVVTGGIAHSVDVVEGLRAKVGWIAPLLVYPGEEELQALVAGAERALRGQEPAKIYHRGGM